MQLTRGKIHGYRTDSFDTVEQALYFCGIYEMSSGIFCQENEKHLDEMLNYFEVAENVLYSTGNESMVLFYVSMQGEIFYHENLKKLVK